MNIFSKGILFVLDILRYQLLRIEDKRIENIIFKTEYENPVLGIRYSPWNTDADFNAIYIKIKNNSLVDKYRMYEIWELIDQTKKLNGSIIEIGVWKGGTGCLIAKKIEIIDDNTNIYLADTFSGVVKTTAEDYSYFGNEHNETSSEIVLDLLNNNLKSLKNIQILEGIFPNETGHLVTNELFKLVHIDVDTYQSAKEIVEWIWNKIVPNGIIIFDDYGFKSCIGITNLVNQLKKQTNCHFIYNINGHGLLIKLG